MSGMYWYAVAASDDVAGLKNKGFCITDDSEILYNEQYEYALVRMYTHDGHGIVDVETSNFTFDKDASDRITINAEDPMTTPVKSYKIRMTDKYPGAQWFYFSPDQEDVLLADDTWMYLYEPDGTPAQDIYYRGMELEALNPIQSEGYEYSRFDGVEFGFRLHGGVGQLRIKFDSVVDNFGDEWPYGKRIRVLVTEPAAPSIPMGGVLTATSDSVIRVPVEQAGGVIEVYVPPVVLPTVSMSGDFGENNSVTLSVSYQSLNIYSGQSMNAYYNEHTIVYDSSKAYAVHQWRNGSTASNSRLPYLSVVSNGESSNLMQIKNIYSGTLNVNSIRIAVCSSPDATVITVYDSSNTPYNAFQYTSDGTDYYYVLDGTQTDWTDDLESIGYHVIYTAYFTTAGASGTGDTKVGGNYGYTDAPIYDAAGNTFLFDLTKKYTISGAYNYSGESVDLSYGRIVDRNGIAMLYPGLSRFVFRMILILSPQTVIDAYFTNQGSSATSDTYVGNSITYTLYDASGNTIPYDATKTYTTVAAFSVNGDTAISGDNFTGYASYSDSILKGRANGATHMFRLVIRVE